MRGMIRGVVAVLAMGGVLAACHTQEMRERGVEENAAKGWDSAGNVVAGPAGQGAAEAVAPADTSGAAPSAPATTTP